MIAIEIKLFYYFVALISAHQWNEERKHKFKSPENLSKRKKETESSFVQKKKTTQDEESAQSD